MEKRYQVFVSSTYEDLQSERQEVMQALLELDCLPSGMELFPAANESQWSFIKKVIRDCDYYIVIVAGRYGSLSPSGIGYTEMEYRYAVEIDKPIIGFLHKDPGQLPANKSERDPEGQQRLRDFRALVGAKLCKHWGSSAELGSVVSRSLIQIIKSTPATGWVRATDIGDPAETIRLRSRIEELETELAALSSTGPKGTEELAQGDDHYDLEFTGSIFNASTYKSAGPGKFESRMALTWNEIMTVGLPPLVQEGTDKQIASRIEEVFWRKEGPKLLEPGANEPPRSMNVNLSPLNLQQIITQFSALGLIIPSTRQRSLRDTSRYWKLTPYGRTVMTRLSAVRRSPTNG